MISLEALQSAISNVSVWRQGDVCAPHKPLLLLYVLSQYKAGHPRLFNYGLVNRHGFNRHLGVI